MRKTYPNSRLEIWNAEYINFSDKRAVPADRNVDIVQIEYANDGDYIVELVEKAEQEKVVDEMELARQIVDGNNEQKYPI